MNILRLHVNDKNTWIIELLHQYFNNIAESDASSADIELTNNEDNINILVKKTEQLIQLPKPVVVSQLINIIEQANQTLSISIGPIEFYPQNRLCKFNDEEIQLTQKEAEILLYLTNNPDGVDKNTLLYKIWGYSDEFSTHTLETHIYKLRIKFSGKHDIISLKNSYYILNT